jgi:hypothetical protein
MKGLGDYDNHIVIAIKVAYQYDEPLFCCTKILHGFRLRMELMECNSYEEVAQVVQQYLAEYLAVLIRLEHETRVGPGLMGSNDLLS